MLVGYRSLRVLPSWEAMPPSASRLILCTQPRLSPFSRVRGLEIRSGAACAHSLNCRRMTFLGQHSSYESTSQMPQPEAGQTAEYDDWYQICAVLFCWFSIVRGHRFRGECASSVALGFLRFRFRGSEEEGTLIDSPLFL